MVGRTSLNAPPTLTTRDSVGTSSTSDSRSRHGGGNRGNRRFSTLLRRRTVGTGRGSDVTWEWRRALTTTLLLATPPVLVSILVDSGDYRITHASAAAWLDFQLVLAVAAGMLYSRWRMSGEPTSGWLAATLFALVLGSWPFAVLDMPDLLDRSGSTGDLAAVILGAPVLVMLGLAARGVGFSERVHPLTVGVATGLAFVAAHLTIILLVTDTVVVFPGLSGSLMISGLLLIFLIFLIILTALHRGQDQPSLSTPQFAVVAGAALAALLLGPMGTTGGTLRSWAALATLVALSVLVALTTAKALLRTLADQSRTPARTGHSTPVAADQEERATHEELLHELRSTVADISSASQLLLVGGERLSASSRQRLQIGLISEVTRLQRLVTKPPEGETQPVSLDEVISPLIITQRALGHDVIWNPSGQHACGRKDDISEIVHILLHNALRHAPDTTITLAVRRTGDAVEVRVSDGGPGVPSALRGSLFQRGARSEQSPGSGLGLYLARQLAEGQGGSLQLRHNDGTRGASFVVTLSHFEGEGT